MRGVIVGTVVACLAVAMAPWFSGGQEPVAMLAGGFGLLLAALLLWRQPAARVLRWGPLAAAFVVFLGWALASLAWSANRYSTVLWVSEWALAGLAFWVANTVAAEPKGRNWLLGAYLWSAVGFCAVALVMFFTGTYGRLTGTFYWANPAAAYLIPAVVLGADKLRLAAIGRTEQAIFVGVTDGPIFDLFFLNGIARSIAGADICDGSLHVSYIWKKAGLDKFGVRFGDCVWG